jgi:hypothetical protein
MSAIDWTQERIDEVLEALNKYIDETEVPVLAEFCYKNDIRRSRIYELDVFKYAREKLIEKKESVLFLGGLSGKYNCSMAQFGLNQLGWKTKTEVDVGGQKDNPLELKIKFVGGDNDNNVP